VSRISTNSFWAMLGVSVVLHASVFGYFSGNDSNTQLPPRESLLQISLIEEVAEAPKSPVQKEQPEQIIEQREQIQEEQPAPAKPEPQPEREPKPAPEKKLVEATVEPPPSKPEPIKPQSTPVKTSTTEVSQKLMASYEHLIISHLEKHKQYPRRAVRRGLEGYAVLRIRVAPSGETKQFRLEQGSGSDVLDQEVLKMVQRATPFPTAPKEIAQAIELSIPIAFELN